MDIDYNCNHNIMEMFDEKCVKICAPMVRYSNLAFRLLVRKHGCDLAFTPMIIADSFVRSEKARENDLKSNYMDRPLIVQFAANNSLVFSEASLLVSRQADGVDLNCGCPQRWAIKEGYGCCLLKKPELMEDIVKTIRGRIDRNDFSISVKIRISKDLKQTVEICRRMEKVGCSWLTVHARTPDQKNQPAHWNTFKDIVDSVGIPVVANGDIKSMKDAEDVINMSGVRGVMSARGMLTNPTLFSGSNVTTKECLQDWLVLGLKYGEKFQQFHNHFIYMLEKLLEKPERRIFSSLTTNESIRQFLEDRFGVYAVVA